MQSFRGLADLPDRMGFHFESGGIVTSLPYAEGQLLATITDDWRRVRVPPTILTWSVHHENAPGAGNQLYTIRARRFPIAIVECYFETDPPGQVTSVRVARIHGQGLSAAAPVIVAKVLEGSPEFQAGSDNVVASQEADAQVQNQGGSAIFVNATARTLPPGAPLFGPIYLLPGQWMAFQASTAAVIMGINITWQQFATNVDVLTSGTSPTPAP